MGQQANIVAYDGAAAPVIHTFVGEAVIRQPDGSIVSTWKESLPGVPDYAQIRVTQVKKRLKSGVYAVSVRVEVPVMESISGQNLAGYTAAPKVAYNDTTQIQGFYHERSVTTGRRLSRQLALNIGGNIATSVTPATTGSVPELFDQLIATS